MLHQERYLEDKKVHKEMLNVFSHYLNHNEIQSTPTIIPKILKERKKKIDNAKFWWDAEHLKHSLIAGGRAEWYSYCGKVGQCLIKLKIPLAYNPVTLLDFFNRK